VCFLHCLSFQIGARFLHNP